MAIQYTQTTPHWNYFLSIERDFETITRYIEPCDANNSTFSLELARVLMTASQETDVVMKALCKALDPKAKADNISDYYDVISQLLPELIDDSVRTLQFGMNCQPWKHWSKDQPPHWWTANNKIKHERLTHFDQATFKNTYNSISGLFLAIVHLHYQKARHLDSSTSWGNVMMVQLRPISNLLRLDDIRYMPV